VSCTQLVYYAPCDIVCLETCHFEVKTEADSNDVAGCPRDDKPDTGMFGFCVMLYHL